MKGSYSIPVPQDLKERLHINTHSNGTLPANLRRELLKRLEGTLLEDEYSSLVRLKKEHLNALLDAIDESLSKKEQKRAFAEAGCFVEKNNPAVDHIFGSRSYLIIHQNFDIACQRAGLGD